MSRAYRFDMIIKGLKSEPEKDRAFEGAMSEWEFQAPDSATTSTIHATGIDYITGDNSAEDMALRIWNAVNKSVGRTVTIVLSATYLDNPPDEVFKYGPVIKK